MAQADYVISDQDGASFLVDINAQLAAIVSENSGATEPSTTYAYQLWADTSSGILKQRNAANNAWINLYTLASGNLAQLGGAAFTGNVSTTGSATITGLVDISASTAGQIKFPATQNPSANANTFDDYEEGTWTPTFVLDTPGTSSFTYSVQNGIYTKKGREVTVSFNVTTTAASAGTGTGQLNIGGLPFPNIATYASAGSVGFSTGFTTKFPNGTLSPSGASNLRLYQVNAAAATTTITEANIGSTMNIFGSITYQT